MSNAKTLRAGSAEKRAAIIAAARELFLADGFDRTSVDAIAERAEVSKRTLYDYFGDKQTLLQAVVDAASHALLVTIQRTLDDTLTNLTGHTAAELEDALVTFSMRIATDMLDSAEYATRLRLVRTEFAHLPDRPDDAMTSSAPEEAVGERFTALGEAGLLDIPDGRLAADHFIALTFGVAINRFGSANAAKDPRVQPLIVAGVRAFLRAYRPCQNPE